MTIYQILDRIVSRTMIAEAIHFGDYPRAERLIEQYVDAEISGLRGASW